MTSSPLDRILGQLENVRTMAGGERSARCPAHDDRNKGCAKNYVSRAGARVGLMSTNHFSRYGSRMR